MYRTEVEVGVKTDSRFLPAVSDIICDLGDKSLTVSDSSSFSHHRLASNFDSFLVQLAQS
jgi:hypothetical protein